MKLACQFSRPSLIDKWLDQSSDTVPSAGHAVYEFLTFWCDTGKEQGITEALFSLDQGINPEFGLEIGILSSLEQGRRLYIYISDTKDFVYG